MYKPLVVVSVLLAACGSKGEEDKSNEQASELSSANTKVLMAALDLFTSLDAQKSAEGPEGIGEFGKLVGAAVKVSKELTDAKRVTVGGKLKACGDAWYKASDDFKAAVAPLADELAKGGPEKGHELELISKLQYAWQSKDAKSKACALKQAGDICTAAMKGTHNSMEIMDLGHVCP